MLEKVLGEVTETITGELRRRIKNYKSSVLVPLLKEAIEVKKESDRALMVRLGYEAVSGDWHNVIPAMVALELFDISLIVIDDFFDKQSRRKSKPTIFSKFGPRYAIIAGVVLKSMATRALVEQCQLSDLRYVKIEKLLTIFEETHELIYFGQRQDITFEELKIEHVTEQMYFKMVEATTGSELSAAIKIGGIIGNGSSEEIEALADFGMYVGTIFQIRDDLIDYINNEDLINKTPFSDISQKKKRLPLIVGYELTDEKGRNFLKEIMNKQNLNEDDIYAVLPFVTNKNVIYRVSEIVHKLKTRAEKALIKLHSSKEKKILSEVLELACSI